MELELAAVATFAGEGAVHPLEYMRLGRDDLDIVNQVLNRVAEIRDKRRRSEIDELAVKIGNNLAKILR